MRAVLYGIGLGLALWHAGGMAGDPPELTSETDRISYSLGHQLGRDLQQQGVAANTAAILRGLQDGLAGSEPLLPAAEMGTLLRELKQDIVTTQRQEMQRALDARRLKREQARKDGEAFLAATAKQPGVITLPSGLQYRILSEGQGRRPAVTDTVTVHYRSTLVNGDEFGGTRAGKPESFVVNEVIPGLEEALQRMRQGARWELYIPPQLGFGRRGALEDQTIIYDIELLDIRPADAEPAAGSEDGSGQEGDRPAS
ncbi:MAG: FKBP-type peptidyl-prolyl cis-trans isomerase [Gammaproteobacteria bacterium]|jgi:FKBP-type peptidyl-prolyl cis-trans isomerase